MRKAGLVSPAAGSALVALPVPATRAFVRKVCVLALCAAGLASSAGRAQPADLPIAPATTDRYPPGIKVTVLAGGAVYTNRTGLTLYGMDMRTVLRAGPDPAQYCTGPCAAQWQPLLAPDGAIPNIRFPGAAGRSRADDAADPAAASFVDNRNAPDWTIIKGPAGPQWVFKGWHMVFVRQGDRRGSTAFDGADGKVWNTLKHIPPVPAIVAPGGVQAVFFDAAYAFADGNGRLLFTGRCAARCNDWKPFAGGMASAGIGVWRVGTGGDVPQWHYRQSPVFVAPDAASIPEGGKVMRP